MGSLKRHCKPRYETLSLGLWIRRGVRNVHKLVEVLKAKKMKG
jgi:hypothetical protein